MTEVLRMEQKYLIDYVSYRRCLNHFSSFLTPDPNNGEDGYRIRSLYFDNMEEQDYADKMNGVEVRKKLRLRIYALDSPVVLLEMKQKQGTQQKKRSLQLDRATAQQLVEGNFSPLLDLKSPFAEECYLVLSTGCYRGKTIVEYRRQAFVTMEARTRVTFDTELRACETQMDLFSDSLPLVPVLNPALVILEVKYNGFLLSYIQESINAVDKSALSVSKYCAGRTLLH